MNISIINQYFRFGGTLNKSHTYKGLEKMSTVINQIHQLDGSVWHDLSSLFKYEEMKKGDYFVREGDFDDSVAFILKGVMRAFYITGKGTEYNKMFFTENSFAVSFASSLTGKPGYLNFHLLEDCSLLVTKYSNIVHLYDKHRSIETLIRKIIEYEWVIKKEQREIQLVTLDAKKRYLQFQKDYPGLDHRIPLYQIASNIGITPIQLSRIRTKLDKTS